MAEFKPEITGAGTDTIKEEIKDDDPDPFGGDMSSIMIKPDQIQYDNIGND